MERKKIKVTGIVQGVGFRPFIYNLAHRYEVGGWVLNNDAGVEIEVEGSKQQLANFVTAIEKEAPPLAVVDKVTVTPAEVLGESEFVIKSSEGAAERTVLISPDVATCPDCQRELLAPGDRRYHYAFTNCTNCGPRYTIIKDVPYDRAATTMAAFTMCPACQAEYDDAANRRFHAQPNACAVCGPHYRLIDGRGQAVIGDALIMARQLVAEGNILAIKGLGGYHLACDARNELAVSTLRKRKLREDKPFALMAGSLEIVRRYCQFTDAEQKLLTGIERPIVLLTKSDGYDLANSIAPSNPNVGMMLPYAPIHWLLIEPTDVWVMTSGNISDEPIAYDDEDAQVRLAGIADYFLIHNRPIYRQVDDSVVRVFGTQPYLLRRSRGYVPRPLTLASEQVPVLACGGELKNTFCLTRGNQAFLSSHIGDLENIATYNSYKDNITHFKRLLAVEPAIVAHDLHPEYLSTKYAMTLPLERVGVQHHHAHIAAVLAEHCFAGPVIGVAFDGTGYGTDGNLWGGEFLVADCRNFSRIAHLRYLPLPGGLKAIKEPWRMALWLLHDLYGRDLINVPIAFTQNLPDGWQLLIQAATAGLNAPLSSGVGRLFDAAAAILGIRNNINYEGQAAVELELAAMGVSGKLLPYKIVVGTPHQLDFRPTVAALVDALVQGTDRRELAASFHNTLAVATVDMIGRISRDTGITTIALSGGVFQNMTLLRKIAGMLAQRTFTVLTHQLVPPNDGGLAFGQAIIAGVRSR